MSAPSMMQEYAVWLGLILASVAIVQYWAWYLVLLWSVYFFTVRMLEKLTIDKLDQKPVLISGCDSGFGFDLAIKCIEHGMPVFAACLTEAGITTLTEAAKQVRNGSSLLHAVQCNITNPESVKRARQFVDERIGRFPGLHAIVNNAGVGDNRAWDDWQTPEMYQRFFDINTLGHIRITHAFKDLVKKCKGRIVSVTSICAKVCPPTGGPYNVSKHAIAAYSDTIRLELEQFGVHVSALEPGFYRTPQANPAAAKADVKMVWDRLPDKVKEEYGTHYLSYTQNLVAGYLGYKCKPYPEQVVDAYFNAITSKHPRRRYQIGFDSMFQMTGLSYLPTRLQQYVFYYYLKYWESMPEVAIKPCAT